MRTILFGKGNCRQCKTIKSFLDAKEIPFEFIDIDKAESSGNIVQAMRMQEAKTLFHTVNANVWLFYKGEFHGYAKAIRILEEIE